MEKYTKVEERFLDEINTKMTIYKHNKTGARICTLSNDDPNKVFAIAFKTPAVNSTGVTHIIEHSVLCGSKKYPVRDPFVELLKGSLNTFLNAFTYPDKTVYPCASLNDKDFKNLMGIYLDAVFFPRMYTNKSIFLQEGWHYEINKKEDPIKLNGVVYNEMKGALSNPDEVMQEGLMNGLYPDNCYCNISGGDPEFIPTLTYDFFKDFHKNYYSPSNSYIYLYGNMDMEERLEYLDKEYLSKFDYIDIHPVIKDSAPFTGLKTKTVYYPVTSEDTQDNKTNLGLAINLVHNTDVKLNIAFKVLDRVLINGSGAVLKKKLLEAGIGDDIEGGNNDGINETTFGIIAKNTSAKKSTLFLETINSCLTELANGKLDHETILSYLNNMEFAARENKFSYMPAGLEDILKSLDTWLYDDKAPALELDTIKYYEALKEDLNHGLFEDLIKKYLIENKHKFLLIQEPSMTIQDEKDKALALKLEKYKASLSDKEIEDLIQENVKLREYQTTPDSKEAIDTIPHLSESDLVDKPTDYKCEVSKNEYALYHNTYFTNKIFYGNYNFDCKKISPKYASRLALLANLLTKLPTKTKSDVELDKSINMHFGTFGVSFVFDGIKDTNDYNSYMSVSFSSLSENLECSKDLCLDVILNSNFDDADKLFEIINSEKARLDQAVQYGHVLVLTRAGRNRSIVGYYRDETSGIGYIDFINDLSKNFEAQKDKLIKELKCLVKHIFLKENYLGFVTCDKGELDKFKKVSDELYSVLPIKDYKDESDDFKFEKKKYNEGFVCPFDINFVCRSASLEDVGAKYNGKMAVLVKALSLDYMWQNIRVKGGAYGGGILIAPTGRFGLYSYRDPHVKETNDTYLGLPEFVKNINISDEYLLKLKIGAISDNTQVLHCSDAGRVGFAWMLKGYKYEDSLKENKELISCTSKDIASYAEMMSQLINDSTLVAIGNAKGIEENSSLFNSVRKLY